MASARPAKPVRKATVPVVAVMVALFAAEWILFVAGTKLHEMLVGAVCVALATCFLVVVYRRSGEPLQLNARDVLQAWRIPGYLLSDSWVLIRVLFADLLGERAGSFYRVSGFRTSRRNPELVGRRVLATVYTSMSPNAIIIGIDWEQSRMLVHQIERSPTSKLTRNLGGQS